MPFLVREGDSTTTGGFVLAASATQVIDLRRVARMGDPVWCPACKRVGFITQGNPTWIDEQVAVATHGHQVQCGCKPGTHCVQAPQQHFQADMEASIALPDDMAEAARAQAEQLTLSIKDGTFNSRLFRPIA